MIYISSSISLTLKVCNEYPRIIPYGELLQTRTKNTSVCMSYEGSNDTDHMYNISLREDIYTNPGHLHTSSVK